jgi:transcription elongation factor Elf1
MEKKIVTVGTHIHVKYRCDKCRIESEGVVKKKSGSIQLTCKYCGNTVVVYV